MHFRSDIDPGFVRDLVLIRIFTLKSDKCHILDAACHRKTSRHKHSFFKFFRIVYQCQERYFFALIFFRIIHTVHVPDCIVCIGDLDHIRRKIKRKFLRTFIQAAVLTLEDELCLAVLCLDITAAFAFVRAVITAVKDHDICLK